MLELTSGRRRTYGVISVLIMFAKAMSVLANIVKPLQYECLQVASPGDAVNLLVGCLLALRFCIPFSFQLRLNTRWCLILILAAVRCIYTLTEQPGGSQMRRFPYFEFVEEMINLIKGGSWLSTFLFLP